MTILEQQGAAAKRASRMLATAGTNGKNQALEAIARILMEKKDEWLAANAQDVAEARSGGMRESLLDRLTLTEARIDGIVDGIRQIIALQDPIGKVTRMDVRPNGLTIGRRLVPLGVIAILYEARPMSTVDAAVLCTQIRQRG